jgi:hypothetical protein
MSTKSAAINQVFVNAPRMRSWRLHSRFYARASTDEARQDSAAVGFEPLLCGRRGPGHIAVIRTILHNSLGRQAGTRLMAEAAKKMAASARPKFDLKGNRQ